MTANDVYKLMLYIINKSQSASFSPDNFNRTINAAQLSYTNYLLGEFQKYQYGRAIAQVEFGQNMRVRERLSPFISFPVYLFVEANGGAIYPENYLAFDAMYIGSDLSRRVRYAEQDKLSSYIGSVIDPVTADNPVFTITDAGFIFYPNESISQIHLSYIRKPVSIVYSYTEDSQGRPVYDAGSSRDPEWRDLDIMQIIVRALAMVGVNLQAGMVEQYSQIIKSQGQ
jgi:hypothetical protein